MVADTLAYYYAIALQRALKLITEAPQGQLERTFPRTPARLYKHNLPPPVACDPDVCNGEARPLSGYCV